MTNPIVRLEKVGKKYGSVVSLKDVTLEIGPNEIVGLIGDNGAGKSTLIKVLSGAVRPTSGDIYIKGRKVEIRSTTDAIANGIGVGFVTWVVVRSAAGKGREISPLLWIVAAGFVVYFARSWIQSMAGV